MGKIIYVIGVFDLFHRGHVELLRRSRALGDRLVVAVNSDRLVAEYKRAPIYTEKDRLAIVQSCRYVDEAFIIDTYDNREIVKKYPISAIVHGDDWNRESYLSQIRLSEEFLTEHGVELLFVPYTGGVSTSEIIQKIKAG